MQTFRERSFMKDVFSIGLETMIYDNAPKNKVCVSCLELKENAQIINEHDEYICIVCWLRKERINDPELTKIKKDIDLYFNMT